MQSVWITTAEVKVRPGDMPSGSVLGFMKITLWASSESEFLDRIRAYLGKYDWELISADDTAEVDPSRDYGDEVNQIIDKTLADNNFIGLGTYHGYKLT